MSGELDSTITKTPSKGSEFDAARFIDEEDLLSTPSTRKHPLPNNNQLKMKKLQGEYSESKGESLQKFLDFVREDRTVTPARKQRGKASQLLTDRTAELKDKYTANKNKTCTICLCEYTLEKGSLGCLHEFCFNCIQKWAQSSTACPICRVEFTSILKIGRETRDGPVKDLLRINVEEKRLQFQSEYDHYMCYECGTGQDEDVLLICDECDFYCCHVYCDPVLNGLPAGDWFCIYCREQRRGRRRRSGRMGLIPGAMDLSESEIIAFQESFEELERGRRVENMASRTRSRVETRVDRSHLGLLRSVRRRVR